MMAMAAAEEQISKDRTRNKVYTAGDWVGEKKSFFLYYENERVESHGGQGKLRRGDVSSPVGRTVSKIAKTDKLRDRHAQHVSY